MSLRHAAASPLRRAGLIVMTAALAAADAFRAVGARWFVLEQPGGDPPADWQPVPGTPYAVRSLREGPISSCITD